MAHTDRKISYRGQDLDIVIEGDWCIYEGIYENIRLRNKDGFPISERLENALIGEYGEEYFAECLHDYEVAVDVDDYY